MMHGQRNIKKNYYLIRVLRKVNAALSIVKPTGFSEH